MGKFKTKTKPGLGIRQNILVVLLPCLTLSFNRFFYILARLISHNVYSSPDDFLTITSLPFKESAFSYDLTNINCAKNTVFATFVLPYVFCYAYGIIVPYLIYFFLGKKPFYTFVTVCWFQFLIGFLLLVLIPTKQNPESYTNVMRFIYGDKAIKDYMANHSPLTNDLNTQLNGGNKAMGGILDMIFHRDLPDNLSPSFHILGTFTPWVVCCFPSEKTKKINWPLFSVGAVMMVLVSLSILFIHQHCSLDIFVAVLCSLTSFFLATRINKVGERMQKFCEQNNDFWFGLKKGERKIVFAGKIIIFVLLVSFFVYFSFISLLEGDPFQALGLGGHSDSGQQFNYMKSG